MDQNTEHTNLLPAGGTRLAGKTRARSMPCRDGRTRLVQVVAYERTATQPGMPTEVGYHVYVYDALDVYGRPRPAEDVLTAAALAEANDMGLDLLLDADPGLAAVREHVRCMGEGLNPSYNAWMRRQREGYELSYDAFRELDAVGA